MSEYQMLIGGELVDGDHRLDVINPATERPLASCPAASQAQLDAAVAAAKAAFPAWSALSLDARRDKLLTLVDALAERSDEFARLLTQEQGKPFPEAQGELAMAEGFMRHLAQLPLDDKIIEDSADRFVRQRRKPLGPVALILPWNFPLALIGFKLPLALLAGNTVILKPAPTTPLTALRFGELCRDILPAGVVNIIVDRNDLGEHLTAHPDIAKISFTGSTATGTKVMASAAASLKRLTLELGGNDAAIVLDDVEPAAVAEQIYGAAFMNAGQVCLAVKRVYAQSAVYDDLCDALARRADAAVVDDGMQQGAEIGPIQNKAQYDKVRALIDSARKDGKIIAGGIVEDRPGYFIRPTIVRDIADGTALVDQEQFGPVLPVVRFDDIDEALARANASPWGLGGSIWSADVDRAERIAERMDSGTVWINKHIDLSPGVPFGGAKQSGIGMELAEDGLLEFTQSQIVNGPPRRGSARSAKGL